MLLSNSSSSIVAIVGLVTSQAGAAWRHLLACEWADLLASVIECDVMAEVVVLGTVLWPASRPHGVRPSMAACLLTQGLGGHRPLTWCGLSWLIL